MSVRTANFFASVSPKRSRRALARKFQISVATVVKRSQCARTTCGPTPKPMAGRRLYLVEVQRDTVIARFAAKPGLV